MTSSSEVMCLKQKPQRTLIPNYQWTRCHVCRPWISKLPLVGRHEHACGARARVLFPMTGFELSFFFFVLFFPCTSQFRNCLKYQIVGFSTWVSWSPPHPPFLWLHREAAGVLLCVYWCQYFLTFFSCSCEDTQPVVYPLYTPLLDGYTCPVPVCMLMNSASID